MSAAAAITNASGTVSGMYSMCDQGFGFSAAALLSVAVNTEAVQEGLCVALTDEWMIDLARFEGQGALLAALPLGVEVRLAALGAGGALHGTTLFYRDLDNDRAFVVVAVGMGTFGVQVLAPSLPAGLAAIERLKAAFPPYELPQDETRPQALVKFWMLTHSGPIARARTLDVVTWESVRANYPRATGGALENLATFRPHASGQLMIMHGPPGAGKTFAIRALGWNWRHWCSLHYILDVPDFLNGSPDYIHTLLFDDNSEPPSLLSPFSNGPDVSAAVVPPREKWKLVILEDTGELLTADAKDRTGAGLARLLNAADGLLGQGSRVLFLITTNEPLDSIHPAVVRPGRCAANIGFDLFSRSEAREWLVARGVDPAELGAPKYSLAELYALLHERTQLRSKSESANRMGFAA